MTNITPGEYGIQSVNYLEQRQREKNGNTRRGPTFLPSSVFNPPKPAAAAASDRFHLGVARLVEAFRNAGHRAARVDPLRLREPDDAALRLHRFGLKKDDLSRPVSQQQTLGQRIQDLQATYCGAIGYQFSHIHDPGVRDWLIDQIENAEPSQPSAEQRVSILERLTQAELFDSYLRKKHPGSKTFSLEGAESLIVLLDTAIQHAADSGVDEFVIGMAHRGRLNVLANIIDKPAAAIFREFQDNHPEEYLGGGDVKYHLGASCDKELPGGKSIHLSLCFNPSHLEIVGPIAMGRLRAKQDRTADVEREKSLAISIHGDAAFAGEGVVQETLNISQLPDYEIGGTLHVVLNNQLGFTTPPRQGRSMPNATDVACMLQAPILRVNGDDMDAVLRAVSLAMDFRRTFKKDIVIDLICYRRWGHNEIDEPRFTQPLMYEAIDQQPPVRERFAQQLMDDDVITTDYAAELVDSVTNRLREQFRAAEENGDSGSPVTQNSVVWDNYRGGIEPDDDEPDTCVDTDTFRQLLRQTTQLPEGFVVHPRLSRGFEQRQRMADGEAPLDWAAAEALAFTSIAADGHPVRVAGQDSVRGTFGQRHAVLHDVQTGDRHCVLDGVQVINSPLSELAAMAFEYGYSLDHPSALVCWEAQFGDFVNAGQVVIDQFLSSAEDKWNRLSGLVLLLPHGFEGQGPEHSSARLERFLTVAAENNLQIVQPSTPAQYFHCLRRQVLRSWRKPLIVLTPKGLLRNKAARSPIEDFVHGRFRRVLGGPRGRRPEPRAGSDDCQTGRTRPARLLICSGKVFYDLQSAREEFQRNDIAIARVEQFYPLADSALEDACQHCDERTEIFWVQDEPENMGAWPYWKRRFGGLLLDRFRWDVIARRESASPATGSNASHQLEQERLLKRAFGEDHE